MIAETKRSNAPRVAAMVLALAHVVSAGKVSGATTWQIAPVAVDVLPGDTFEFDLTLSTDSINLGISYLLSVSAEGSGLFSITGRDVSGSTFTDLLVSNAVLLNPPDALLQPTNVYDAGAGVADVFEPNAPGDWFVARLAIMVSELVAPDFYTISIVQGIMDDGEFGVEIPVESMVVQVIPEPGTVGLVVAAVIGWLFFQGGIRFSPARRAWKKPDLTF